MIADRSWSAPSTWAVVRRRAKISLGPGSPSFKILSTKVLRIDALGPVITVEKLSDGGSSCSETGEIASLRDRVHGMTPKTRRVPVSTSTSSTR